GRLHAWLLRIVAASTASTSMALPSRWRSRPQHQKAAICIAAKEARGCSVLFDHFAGAHLPSPTGAANLPSATNYKVTVLGTRLGAAGGGRVRPSLCACYEILHAFRSARGPHCTGYARL